MSVDGNVVKFARANEEKQTIALHGLVRALFNNCVKGVSTGWEKNLEIFELVLEHKRKVLI